MIRAELSVSKSDKVILEVIVVFIEILMIIIV